MSGIRLTNENDYLRAIEIEAELIRETGYKLPPRRTYITYPANELVDGITAQLDKEGINYEVRQRPPASDRPNPAS